MTCKDLTDRIDDYVDETLDAASAARLKLHVDTCEKCQQTVDRETALRKSLREYGDSSVTIPNAAFFDEALVTAATTGRKQQQKRSWLTGFGSAVAAGLAIWIVSTALITAPVDGPATSVIPTITMTLEEPRTINLVFSSATALDDATLTVSLPEGIEIAGFEGRREITWSTSLSEGKNVLPLRLIGTMPTDGELLATLRHGDDDRTFRLRIKLV